MKIGSLQKKLFGKVRQDALNLFYIDEETETQSSSGLLAWGHPYLIGELTAVGRPELWSKSAFRLAMGFLTLKRLSYTN